MTLINNFELRAMKNDLNEHVQNVYNLPDSDEIMFRAIATFKIKDEIFAAKILCTYNKLENNKEERKEKVKRIIDLEIKNAYEVAQENMSINIQEAYKAKNKNKLIIFWKYIERQLTLLMLVNNKSIYEENSIQKAYDLYINLLQAGKDEQAIYKEIKDFLNL